jgi:branched-chain amino acid aminotransferase
LNYSEYLMNLCGQKSTAGDNKYSRYAWYNGKIVNREDGAPSVASASFHLGTSVFEGMMAYWNGDHYNILRSETHLTRFRRGAERMGLGFSWSNDEMLTGINDLLSQEPRGTQYLRPIAYRRVPELWITGSAGSPVDVSIFSVRTEAHRDIDAPMRCQLSPVERISSRSIPGQIKVSGSYVNSFYARKTAEMSGFDDGVMFDREGRLAEASAANVFAIVGDRLLTPPPNPDVFPGITRQVILELALANGIDAKETDLRRNDLAAIDGAFLCSTLMEIRGLSLLGERSLPTVELPAFKAVVDAFRSLTHQ